MWCASQVTFDAARGFFFGYRFYSCILHSGGFSRNLLFLAKSKAACVMVYSKLGVVLDTLYIMPGQYEVCMG